MPDPVFTPPPFQGVQLDLTYDVVTDIALPPDADNLDMAGGPYLGWGQVTRVKRKTGWAVNEILGDPSGAGAVGDLVSASRGRIEKVVLGVAIRAGDEPDLPCPEADTDTMKLAESEAAYFNPSVTPNGGTRVYGLIWLYRYIYSVPPASGSSVLWGKAPFDLGSAQPLDPNKYLNWLLGGC